MTQRLCVSVCLALALAFASAVYGGAWPAAAQPVPPNPFVGDAMGIGTTATPRATETVTPESPTPPPTPTPNSLGLVWDDRDSLVWRAVPNALSYELTGTAYAVRANATSPFCAPPLSADAQNITINEVLDGSATSFRITLPTVAPGDVWFVASVLADLRALDANGATIASDHVGFLFETYCGTSSTPVPSVLPPDAGTGRPSGDGGYWSAAIAVGCGLALVAAGFRRLQFRD